jgi:hypothetical protein
MHPHFDCAYGIWQSVKSIINSSMQAFSLPVLVSGFQTSLNSALHLVHTWQCQYSGYDTHSMMEDDSSLPSKRTGCGTRPMSCPVNKAAEAWIHSLPSSPYVKNAASYPSNSHSSLWWGPYFYSQLAFLCRGWYSHQEPVFIYVFHRMLALKFADQWRSLSWFGSLAD